MRGNGNALHRLVALSAGALFLGCASLPRLPVVEDVHPRRVARQEEAVRQLDAHRDRAEFSAALDSWRQSDVADCTDRLERLLRRNPGHRAAALLLAEAAWADGAPQAALPHLERIAAERPDDADVQRALQRLRAAAAGSSVELASYAQSLPADAARETDSGLGDSALAGADEGECLRLAGECLRRGDDLEAARLAELGLRRLPRSAALYRLSGLAHYRGADYGAAEAALRQSLSLDNSSALAYFLLGSALRRLGESEEAETQFRRARTIDPRY